MNSMGRDHVLVPWPTLTKAVWMMTFTLAASLVFAQSAPQRPRILGIAHVALYESDLGKARAFYKGFLGFAEPFSLKHPDGTDWIVSIKVNDQQYLELFSGTVENAGHLSHVALYTDDVAAMQRYLASLGVAMIDQIHTGQSGDRFFTVKDPDGHIIEIVEYQPNSRTSQQKGKFLPAARISNRLIDVGILVEDAPSAMNFYGNILGLQEIARNSTDEKQLRWIDLRAPEGNDYVELMLDPGPPSPAQHKAQNHISFEAVDVQKTATDLQSRASTNNYTRPIQLETGNNQGRVVNLFDPDGARIEIIEPPHR